MPTKCFLQHEIRLGREHNEEVVFATGVSHFRARSTCYVREASECEQPLIRGQSRDSEAQWHIPSRQGLIAELRIFGQFADKLVSLMLDLLALRLDCHLRQG